MLNKAKSIQGFKLSGTDGEVGNVKEFIFDDNYWAIRYLVVSTGGWLSGRQVLISPFFIQGINYDVDLIHVDLTRSEIENSPRFEDDMTVSPNYEEEYYNYYGSPVYWDGPQMWGSSSDIVHDREKWETIPREENVWSPKLNNTKDVRGHFIQATDNEVGHVDDFIFDDENWAIRYLIIDTKNWLPGKKVLISPEWIDKISWEDSKVYVQLTRDAIRRAPEYDDDIDMITREYESKLYRYYEKQGYWAEEKVGKDYSR